MLLFTTAVLLPMLSAASSSPVPVRFTRAVFDTIPETISSYTGPEKRFVLVPVVAKKGPEKWVYDDMWQPRKMVRDDYVNKHDRVDQEDIWGNGEEEEEAGDRRRQEEGEKRRAMKNFILLNYGMRKRGNGSPATEDPKHYYLHM